MSNSIRDDQMRFIVEKILDNAADVQKERSSHGKNDFNDGMMCAYYQMLDTMKNQLIVDDRDLKEFGLDINLEEKLA